MLAPSRAPVGSVKTRSGGLKFTLTFASGSSLGLAVRVRPESDTAKYAQAYSTAVHSVTPGSQGAIQGVCEGDVLLALNEGGAAGAGSGRRDSSASGGGGGLRDVPYEAVVVMVRTAPRPLKVRSASALTWRGLAAVRARDARLPARVSWPWCWCA